MHDSMQSSKVLYCFGPKVLLKMENTLSEAAERVPIVTSWLLHSNLVSLLFHHWQMSGGFTPLALAR